MFRVTREIICDKGVNIIVYNKLIVSKNNKEPPIVLNLQTGF